MLKKITEPQAIYSKAPTPGQPAQSSFTKPPRKTSKFNWKIAGSIIAVFVVAVVGIAGVLIAQRQQADQSPVAPNAPESKPKAQIEPTACSLSFEVQPPPPGAAKCVSKTAVDGTGAPLAANSTVKRGDLIGYLITIQPNADTSKVTIVDTLPPHLELVPRSEQLNRAEIVGTRPMLVNNVLTYSFNLTAEQRSRTHTFAYVARVKEDAPTTGTAANFTNAAKVTYNDVASTSSSCSIPLAVASPPPTGVGSCVSKEVFKSDGTPFGDTGTPLAKRGDVLLYKILVEANSPTGGPVVVTDVLPPALTYKPGSAKIGTAAVTTANFSETGQTLRFELGQMYSSVQNRQINITYEATVNADAQVAPFSNTVTVSTDGKAATTPPACKATLQVAPVGLAVCKSKEAFTNYGGTKIANESVVQKGTTFAYKLTVAATETTAGSVVVVDTLPPHLEFVESRNNTLTHSNGKLTATLPAFGDTAANQTKVFEYKVTVRDTAAAGPFENEVTVTTAGNTAQADSCKLTLHVPYQCDATCTTDAQCQTANAGFICSKEAGNKCRLATNSESNSCEGQGTSYACDSSCETNAQCESVNSNYTCAETNNGKRCRLKDHETQTNCQAVSTPTPTPTIGCNVACVTNADCSNPDHICYTTSDGSQLCRLDTNPTSTSCTVAGNPGTPSTPQPQLPEELPQSGPENWVNWLKAGLITLGIGAVLLLLL